MLGVTADAVIGSIYEHTQIKTYVVSWRQASSSPSILRPLRAATSKLTHLDRGRRHRLLLRFGSKGKIFTSPYRSCCQAIIFVYSSFKEMSR